MASTAAVMIGATVVAVIAFFAGNALYRTDLVDQTIDSGMTIH